MKKIYTLTALLSASLSFGQNIEIHQGGVPISGNTFEVDSASTVEYSTEYFYLVNTSSTDQNVSWSRTRTAHDNSIVEDQLCDKVLCFTCEDQTVYNRPGTMTIASGDSSVFQPKVYPGDQSACLIYTYKIFSGLGALEDSIQMKWRFDGANCFAFGMETEIEYSVYPNPADDLFFVNVTTNNNDVEMSLYNILGESVSTQKLTDGKNQVDVSELTSGVYFYSIRKNGKAIETKKLVVR